ncbi:ParB/RepB/Spo0J family partition protein [Novosphingobium mangrovi (ex Hu et al. 2023)]|uniref:ParB/RepB/Spo0J family partition protein n=1 Tax=Novosphingobium mangrovi (ex Hu et al. 2023) TaxID=2930094 RepID=A0ABT0AG27_9SPHN|nr:ParB/RepB/Spo0J family partition protein [Novosphingobium mangrovi (ex Hu et al. 2023)]MCJ1962145.1 ParB/RepB/Spo0J family partition protein [Novosphingobium mangrovi (ex Hu et al. 2023)]
MARKQSDYLASLLSGGDDTAETKAEAKAPSPAASPDEDGQAPSADTPSPAPPAEGEAVSPAPRSSTRAGLSLLGRENALARVASGEVRQVTQLLLDPARVRVWDGNARNQARLSEDSCRDLIDSILAEGGQKVPAVVRHITGDPDHDYELIAGTRRHFAISWLRAHSYPDMKLLAQVAELDDEAAFRLADIENRARRDITDIERARNYAEALPIHYGGKAVRMAERLKLSKGWLSKMLKAATIPDEVLAAFADPAELTLNPAYRLAGELDDKARARAIRKEAKAIAAQNAKARSEGRPGLPGPVTLKRLLAASDLADSGQPLATKDFRMEISGPYGRTILAVKDVTRQGVTIQLPMASGAGDEQLANALKEVLDVLRKNGISVS